MQTLGKENRETIELFFSAGGLPKDGLFSKTHPRIGLYKQNERNGWTLVGKTEAVSGNQNPVFKTAILIDYIFQSTQPIRVVLEEDGDKGEEYASARLDLAKIVSAPKRSITVGLVSPKGKPSGTVLIVGSPTIREKYFYNIKIKCKDIKNVELLTKSDPCVRIYRPKPLFIAERDAGKIPDDDWHRVHETEFKMDNLNPDFNEFSLSSNVLNRGDEEVPLRVEVWDYSKDGERSMSMIGRIVLTTKKLLEGSPKEYSLLSLKGKPVGTLIVEKFIKELGYYMMDYLQGGLNIGQVVLVDYTESNGVVTDAKSLHHLSAKPTVYEDAIRSVGTVLFQYDKDQKIPVYGMGASFPTLGVQDSKNFFYIQKQDLSYASNIEESIALYKHVLEVGKLAGPCKLAPAINSTGDWVRSFATVDRHFYGVLLILTDGEVSDMEDTIRAIIDAAHLPFSIIIVGLGNKDFSDLKKLDGDKYRIRDSNGRCACRDIVTFVDYKQTTGINDLSENLLEELPNQIVQYFRVNKIRPAGVF